MTNKFHPVSAVYWVNPERFRANDYNPNHVFGPEMELLELSLLEDGFTQPAVVVLDEGIEQPPTWPQAYRQAMEEVFPAALARKRVDAAALTEAVQQRALSIVAEATHKLAGTVVDGFHRRTLAITSEKVRALTEGLMPVVFLDQSKSRGDLQLSTIRHNRARGQHGILAMGEIVRELLDSGVTKDDLMVRCGMEEEEVARLSELRGSPEQRGRDSFGKGWVPTRAR